MKRYQQKLVSTGSPETRPNTSISILNLETNTRAPLSNTLKEIAAYKNIKVTPLGVVKYKSGLRSRVEEVER